LRFGSTDNPLMSIRMDAAVAVRPELFCDQTPRSQPRPACGI
jgi:hypothetical protein